MAEPGLRLQPVTADLVLKDKVYHALRDAITRMDIYSDVEPPKLDERRLADELGVSRTPVREALSRLEQEGLVQLARLNHANASLLADKLGAVKGVTVLADTFFNEFTLALAKPAAAVVDALADRLVLGGVPGGRLWPDRPELANHLIVAATETNTEDDMDRFARALAEVL